VSRVPTFSAKTLGSRISRDLVLPLLGVAALVIVSLIAFTWEMLTAMSVLYIALLPFGVRSYRRYKTQYEKRSSEARDNEAQD
jgi:CDP-diacylglycerol--serine O-phosphatidyltransferase